MRDLGGNFDTRIGLVPLCNGDPEINSPMVPLDPFLGLDILDLLAASSLTGCTHI